MDEWVGQQKRVINLRIDTHPEELAPQVEKLETAAHHNVPVGDGHLQVQTLLVAVLGVVECVLVEVLELQRVIQLGLEHGQFHLQLLDAVHAKVVDAVDELVARELALRLRLEAPGDDEDEPRLGT